MEDMTDKRRYIYIVLFIIGTFAITNILNFVIVNDYNRYTKAQLKEIYNDTQYEFVYLGASHTYRSIDPEIVEQHTGNNSLNLGTSSQSVKSSYYLLNEYFKNKSASKIFLEINPIMTSIPKEDELPLSTFIISDYMRVSPNKLEYLYKSLSYQDWLSEIFPFRREYKSIFKSGFLIDNVKYKLTKDYRHSIPITPDESDEYYDNRGFVYSTDIYDKTEHYIDKRLNCDINTETQFYLKKMIQLCNDNSSELILFTAPMTDLYIESTAESINTYNDFENKCNQLAKENNVKYQDFNIISDQYLSLDNSCFKDSNHLNGKGAEIFTKCFVDYFISGNITDSNFYNSWTEKVATKEDIFGLYINSEDQGNKISLEIDTIQNAGLSMEYEIILMGNDGVERKVSDYSHKKTYTLTRDAGYIIKVNARPVGQSQPTNTVFKEL